jgi:P4 family phage/plasmid primase-like protien
LFHSESKFRFSSIFAFVQNGWGAEKLSKGIIRMAEFKTLHAFLEGHKAESTISHTSMKGGKYFIPEEKLNRFYELYVDSVLDGNTHYLTEKPTNIGPLRVDLDFVYDGVVDNHLHTQSQTVLFVKEYINAIGQYVTLPAKFDIHVMEKRKPTFEKKGNRTKSGIHLVVPGVCTHKLVEQSVRRSLVPRMGEFFTDLPLKDSWEKVYDKGVVDRSTNWTLYKSKKNDIDDVTRPYETQYSVQYNDGQFTLTTAIPEISVQLMKDLSMRQPVDKETPMTENGTSLYASSRDKPTTGDTSEYKKRGRTFQRSEKPSSRASSPSSRIIQPITVERKEYLHNHTMNLDKSRYADYDKWVQVGICLYNIHPELLDVFLDFSSQSQDKYDEGASIQKWNSFTFRNDGDRIGEPTLRYWSREDNREGYDDIESRNVDRLIMTACSGTEHDVAAVIFAKFRDHYKCSDFRYNIWYRWMGHVWQRTDQGIDLQLKLSKDIAKVFENKSHELAKDMEARAIISCTNGGGKEECKVCEYCQLDDQKMKLLKMFLRLKTTGFKTNIMKECRELFFDEQFSKKLDANKDIIAFNNGVLDLITFEFRPGKQEDCLSFSTHIDYEVDKPYYEYPAWAKVERFVQQVLPKKEVRDYFVKHLASNLFGGNTAQKFHILTGSGSNGKSMIMNLMTKAMGDYACTVPISLFTQKRKSSGSAAPEVARLKGRRFVTMQEPDEAIALNTGLMKEISSGEKMYARDLFESGSEFEVLAKFHLACNEKPKINTTDGGTWRRLVVINFLSKFVGNPSAANEYPLDESIQFSVNTEEWATPFLTYLVHVLKEGNGLRKLVAPPDVMEYTSDYRNENDAIAKFISEKIQVLEEPGNPVDKAELRRAFASWKNENDQRSLLPTDMEKRIELLFGKFKKGGWTTFKID